MGLLDRLNKEKEKEELEAVKADNAKSVEQEAAEAGIITEPKKAFAQKLKEELARKERELNGGDSEKLG